ncbi:unnamed protein product [Staurois parvus]|uniref:Uncharacterized protein n=1 Tax=Staurois parvus TaxID=386267 RepID=A0ABN9GLZ5_9NEOB|nr:unnamed protein product [Staurois parvus]
MHMGRLHMEIRQIRRAHPPFPETHWYQALYVLGL